MKNRANSVVNYFDDFGDFSLQLLITDRYNIVPSKMGMYLDVVSSKENLDKVIAYINPSTWKLSVIRQKWKLAKMKGSKPEEDYTYYRVYAGQDTPICAQVELRGDQLKLEFFYDHEHLELEKWCLDCIQKVREEFATSKSPVFRVLTKTQDGFSTEKVNLEHFAVDIDRNYNDDFKAVTETISTAITEKQSGLILLHGQPGTGKTSYIKSLVTEYQEQKFIFVPNDFIGELLKPDFVAFLIRQRDAILVIEDAEKVIISRERSEQNSVVSTILQLTDGLFSDYLNIKVICTFNTDVSKIDKALFRKGRMIAFYEFKALSLDKTRKLAPEGQQAIEKGMTLAEIYNLNATDYSDRPAGNRIGFTKR